ncbi:MAG: hypothetical protein PVG70_11620 [Desulfobacterales bacterium]
MSEAVISLGGKKKSPMTNPVKQIIPDGGNLNSVLCGFSYS